MTQPRRSRLAIPAPRWARWAGASALAVALACQVDKLTQSSPIDPGIATHLAFTVQPTAARAHAPIVPPVRVAAQDALGDVATTFTGTVTLALGANPGAAVLAGTVSANAVAGVATFSTLSVDKPGSGYTLTAVVSGLTGAASSAFAVTLAPASQLALMTPPSTAGQSGVPLAQQPAVQLEDSADNAVALEGKVVSAAIAAGPSSASLAAASATTNASGLASFSGLAIGGPPGTYTLTFSASGLPAATAGAIALSPGPAAKLMVATEPSTSTPTGVALAQQPVLQLTDAGGNPVAQAGVAVTAAIASGAPALSGTNPVATNASGLAAFTNLVITGTPGPRTLAFSAPGAAGVSSSTVTVTAGAATQMALHGGTNETATVNTAVAIAPSVIVEDQSGNPVAGVGVTFAVTAGGGSVTGPAAITNASGIATVGSWTLGPSAGANTLTATVMGLAGSPVQFTATGVAANGNSIASAAGNNQTATVNTAVTIPPAVIVRDQFANPVAGVAVTFAVTAGGGSITGAAATTNASGTAAVGSWTLGPGAGANTLTATASGLAGSPVQFTATGVATGGSTLALAAGNNQTATVNSAVATAPAVLVHDQFGNPVAGVAITFAVASGGGNISGAAATTNANGIAAVGSWTLGATAGTNTLTAAASGLAGSPVQFTAHGVSGPAASIAIAAGNAQTAMVGTAVTTPPAVLVRDQFSNPVSGVAVSFAVASGGGSISGAAATTNASGIATLGSWTLGPSAGTNTLSATAPGLAGSPVQFTATGVAAGGSTITIEAGNAQTAPVNTALPTAPAVLVRDQFSNPVAGVAITFAVASGGGGITGPAATTNASGIAAVGSWTLGPSAGTNTLTATASGLAGSPVQFTATGTAAGANAIAISAGNNQTATVGTAVATAPAVIVQDQFGNPVGGVAVMFAVASGGGSATGAAATTNAGGIATVGSWTLGGTAGTNTLTATATGLAGSPVRFTATGVAGPASSIAIAAGNNQSATVGSAIGTPPAVITSDRFGNPVGGIAVTFVLASGGGSLTGPSATTNASGIAAVGSWTLGPSAGANSLTASAPGLAGSPLPFTATGLAGPATSIALSAGNNQSATVNTAVATPPAVIVRDQFSNPVSGVAVTFAVTAGGGSVTGAAATTNAGGIATVGSWTLGGTAGTNTLTATASGLSGSPVPFTATGVVGSAASIAIQAGNAQSATVNSAVATPPAVIVRDASSNPVAGVAVTFAVASGGGSITGASATTNASGIAAVGSWTLGSSAGTNTLTATAPGLTGSPVQFTATGLAGPATSIAVSGGNNQSAIVNTAVATPPAVIVRDQFSNPVSGVAVTFAVTAGGGRVSGAAATTNASGIATVGGWTLGSSPGTNTLTATASGLSGSPVQFTATGLAGPATSIALSAGNNQSATVNTAVATPPAVIVRDQFSNPVSGVAVTFAVTAAGGSVTGAAATTNAGGIATVGSWTLGSSAGTNTLTATAPGLTGSPVQFTATGLAGPATSIALSGGNNQSATVNTPVASPPAVIVRDQFSNPVSGVAVTFAVTSGGGSVTGGSQTTNSAGIAAVGSWTLGPSPGTNALTATASGLSGSPVPFTATAVAAPPTSIALEAGNAQSATVNSAVATPPAVIVGDASSNPVAGVAVTFAVTSGGGSITGASATTNASGIAAVGSWTLGSSAGTNTLTATAPGLTGSPVQFTATGLAGPATSIAVSGGNNQSAIVNTALATPPAVIVRDQFSNPVAGVAVTFAVTSGGGSVTGGSLTTNSGGIAAVGSWTLGTAAGPNTVAASAAGVSGSVTFTATGTAGPPSATQSLVSASPTSITASSGSSTATITVTVRDGFGNPVSGASVTLTATGSGNAITQPSSATDASGRTAGTLSSTGAGTKTITALVNGSTTLAQSASVVVSAGAATTLAFTGEPTNTAANATITPPVVVQAFDAFGNPATGFSGVVTVSITPGSGTALAVLSGTTSVAAVAGVASFGNLSINLPSTVTPYRLDAAATGLAGTTSTPFNIGL